MPTNESFSYTKSWASAHNMRAWMLFYELIFDRIDDPTHTSYACTQMLCFSLLWLAQDTPVRRTIRPLQIVEGESSTHLGRWCSGVATMVRWTFAQGGLHLWRCPTNLANHLPRGVTLWHQLVPCRRLRDLDDRQRGQWGVIFATIGALAA